MGPIWGRQDPVGPHVGPMLSWLHSYIHHRRPIAPEFSYFEISHDSFKFVIVSFWCFIQKIYTLMYFFYSETPNVFWYSNFFPVICIIEFPQGDKLGSFIHMEPITYRFLTCNTISSDNHAHWTNSMDNSNNHYTIHVILLVKYPTWTNF